jgi:hypothetical protein
MSTHVVDAPAGELIELCARFLRRPVNVTAPPLTLTFDPDLTPAEATILARLVALARSERGLDPTDYAAIEGRLATLRTFRQQSQSEFMAKTAAERDRELFDTTTDLVAVVLRLLRD